MPNTPKKDASKNTAAASHAQSEATLESEQPAKYSKNPTIHAFIENRLNFYNKKINAFTDHLNEAIKAKDKQGITAALQSCLNMQRELNSYLGYLTANNSDTSSVMTLYKVVTNFIADATNKSEKAKIHIKDDGFKFPPIPNSDKNYPGAMMRTIGNQLKAYQARIDGFKDDLIHTHKREKDRPYKEVGEKCWQMKFELELFKKYLQEQTKTDQAKIDKVDKKISSLDNLIKKVNKHTVEVIVKEKQDTTPKGQVGGTEREKVADNAKRKGFNKTAIDLFKSNPEIRPDKLKDLSDLINNFNDRMSAKEHPISDKIDNYLHQLNEEVKKQVGISLSTSDRQAIWAAHQQIHFNIAFEAINIPVDPNREITKRMKEINDLILNNKSPDEINKKFTELQSSMEAIGKLDKANLAKYLLAPEDKCKTIRDQLEKQFHRLEKNVENYPVRYEKNQGQQLDKIGAFLKAIYAEPKNKSRSDWHAIFEQLNKHSEALDSAKKTFPEQFKKKIQDLRQRAYEAQHHVNKNMNPPAPEQPNRLKK